MNVKGYPKLGFLSVVALLVSITVTQLGSPSDAAPARNQVPSAHQPLDRIPPGTVIDNSAPAGWSEIVIYAQPRLGSGDVDEVPSVAAKYASMFNLAILAKIGGDRGARNLAGLAIGFTMPVNGRNVVISSATQNKLGANLGFIEKQVLAENEKCLDDVTQICSFPTMSIFDAKAIVLRDDDHRDMIMRHLVWISSKDGRLATAVWLLEQDGQNGYRLASDTLQILPPNFREDRVINVKADKFVLGIPTPDAFALARLPQGTAVKFTAALGEVAVAHQFTLKAAQTLAIELNTAIRQSLRRQATRKE